MLIRMMTKKQKEKMDSLGIEYTDCMTLEEARDAILDNIDMVPREQKRKTAKEVSTTALLENSDFDD